MDARAGDPDRALPLPVLPPRMSTGHKGSFGTVLVVGGCGASRANGTGGTDGAVMIGGPALAAAAAARAGAGLVRLAMPESVILTGLGMLPEAVGLALPVKLDGGVDGAASGDRLRNAAEGAACVVIGPGLGRAPGVRDLLETILDTQAPALVIDADAINALTDTPGPRSLRHAQRTVILTPHLGEFRRLCEWFGRPLAADDPGAIAVSAAGMAERLGAVLVVKASSIVVTDGRDSSVIAGGRPLLGTAGTGDVLAGLLAGLLSQWVRGRSDPARRVHWDTITPFDIARIGVRAHQRSADLWSEGTAARSSNNQDPSPAPPTRGLLASDLLGHLARALEDPD
ncbi:MAG: NAD(P)H-hydrate dehydratase [Phycisphaerales bacterium]